MLSTVTGRPRRWNYFRDRLIEQFGEVVYKVGIDGGFTCPNRDGTKAYAGCAYCSQEGSLSPHQDPRLEIPAQVERGRFFAKKRYKAEKYIAYFQSFTNTYGPVPLLKERFERALIDESIVGLSIASRPDCIDRGNVEYMAELASKLPFFTVELGLQSVYQNRLEWVNRQETVEDYQQAMALLREYKIPVVTHVILGFPGETTQDMEDTVRLADQEGTQGIKLQMLHVIKGTKLGVMWTREPFELMDEPTYRELIIYLVERLRPQVQIHRITGETESAKLLAPEWVRHKPRFFDAFERELEARDTWQGKAIGIPYQVSFSM